MTAEKSVVYFIPTEKLNKIQLSASAVRLLKYYLERENVKLCKDLGLKVHFGERGNVTFLDRSYYQDIIDYLIRNEINPFYIETNVLYQGERTNRNSHQKLAREHGFDDLPIIIADGEIGEDSYSVDIDQKHFQKCLLGKAYEKHQQILVISHFKGHMLSGFGGAVKQLAMGFASRGGKLAQHAGAKPLFIKDRCIKCGKCIKYCPVQALKLKDELQLDLDLCVGCAACIAVCPEQALNIDWQGVAIADFREMLMEYALAADKNKRNIYLNFAVSIAEGCDCEGREMDLVAADLGILVSSDPLAIDRATLDLLSAREQCEVFPGTEALIYGEQIGLGNLQYELIKIE